MFNRLKHDRQNRQLIQRVWDLSAANSEQLSSVSDKRLRDYKEGLHSAITDVLYNRLSTGFSRYPITLEVRKELQQWANKAIKDWQGDHEEFETIREMIVTGYPESYPGGPQDGAAGLPTGSKER